jgi:hypothetical protein
MCPFFKGVEQTMIEEAGKPDSVVYLREFGNRETGLPMEINTMLDLASVTKVAANATALVSIAPLNAQRLIRQIKRTPGFIALWDFKEKSGETRESLGKYKFPLKEMMGPVERHEEGPLSGYSAYFNGSNYLSLANEETGELNINGDGAGVTVIAWIKWEEPRIGFVAGMWNEYANGGKRQYGLFVHLPYYNGRQQVCGHISLKGGPTPPFPYSIDYSASKQAVPRGEWVCIAFSYDGEFIRSYFNGVFEGREPELIRNTKGFPGYPDGLVQSKNPYYYPDGMGNNGSDFTVGAVELARGMGNFFTGNIGGVAVFNRALSNREIRYFSKIK